MNGASGTARVSEPVRIARNGSGVLGDKSKGISSMTGVIGERENSYGHGFLGSSSAGSSMRQTKSAIDVKVGFSRRPSFSGTTQPSLFTASPVSHLDEDGALKVEYVLPPRKTADNLVAVYWNLVYPLYPFLDWQRFEEAYQSVWSGSTPNVDEKTLICTINVVFALGCQITESIKPENRENSAKAYFKRAQELLTLDL